MPEPVDQPNGEQPDANAILKDEDFAQIDVRLEEWREGWKAGGAASTLKQYVRDKALEHMEALEHDVRLCRTATELKAIVDAHAKVAEQVSKMANDSEVTPEQAKEVRKRILRAAMTHMLALDVAVTRVTKPSDKRALMLLSLALRETAMPRKATKKWWPR